MEIFLIRKAERKDYGMKKKVKLLRIGLSMVMAVSVSACGSSAGGNASGTAASDKTGAKNYVYKEDVVSNGSKYQASEINSMSFCKERIYDFGYHYADDGSATFFAENYKADGSDYKSFEIKGAENVTFSYPTVDTDGNIYVARITYAAGDQPAVPAGALEDAAPVVETDTAGTDSAVAEDTGADASETASTVSSSTDIAVSEDTAATDAGASESTDAATSDQTELVKYDSTGKEIWKIQMGKGVPADSGYYINGISFSEKYGLFISDSVAVNLYNPKDGSLTKKVMDVTDGSAPSVYAIRSGKVLIATYESNGISFRELDMTTGKESDPLPISKELSNYSSYYTGPDYDLYLTGSDGISALNIGDTKVTRLVDFVDSDIDASYVGAACIVSSTQIAAVISGTDNDYTLAVLTKVPPKDVADKKVITMGCTYIDYRVRSEVIKFNKSSSDYRIKILDYSQYNSEDDYNAGLTKLNTDIVSGNTPDLMILDSSMPSDSYISKGVLKNLDGYFKKDEELQKNKYLTNILEAFQSNGKMYTVMPSFSIYTVAAKTKDVGNVSGWTMEDLEKLRKKKNADYATLFGPTSQDAIMSMAMMLSGEDFIDWEKQDCSYNSDGFISLLNFISKFPKKDPTDANTDYSAYWREGKSLLNWAYLGSYNDYNNLKKGTFGDDITLIGFPTASKKGSVILPDFSLAMSATTKNDDGCWQFLRTFLTQEYQDAITGSFPVSETTLEKLGQAAMKNPTTTDENGKVTEEKQTWYIGGQEVEISPMTQEEVQTMTDFIKSLSVPYSYNQDIQNIITEETAPFLQGQKQAADVANIIQSKVRIYVNENS